MSHVVVIGGGISGLAAAWELTHDHRGGTVTVVEASEHLGGKIGTAPFAGIDLDTGPDSFLARVPAATQLAREAGLGDELVAPATGRAWMWARGRLRPLPPGLVLGVPTDIGALARSGVLPFTASVRAGFDLVLPGRPVGPTQDLTVGELVRRRMGRAVQLGLVDPLMGGINAAHTDHLSAAVAAPQLLAAARRAPSLIRGLRSTQGTASSSEPVFLTVRGGLRRLVDALARGIIVGGGDIVTGQGAVALAMDGPRWAVRLSGGRVLIADAVVVACPSAAAASLVRPVSAEAGGYLASIRSASVVLTMFAYPDDALTRPLAGSGFLVPRAEGRLLTAASWVGPKWPHLATPGTVVIRASAGRVDNDLASILSDEELAATLHGELAASMGLRTQPTEVRVHRWPQAFPQYEVGHLTIVERIERRLSADAPGVVLAGAALRGVGLATCISGGRDAAVRARSHLAAHSEAGP